MNPAPSDGQAVPPDLADRTKDFTGRGWVFDRVDAFLGGEDRTFLIAGDPGTGKSAIAARLLVTAGKGWRIEACCEPLRDRAIGVVQRVLRNGT